VTFLIADNNPALRDIIKNVLVSPDNTYIECSNGKEAIECYSEYKPDWVIIDSELDKIDGIAVSQKITDKFPQANILILTQYDDIHLKKAAFKAGVKEYFLKDNIIQLKSFFKETRIKNQIKYKTEAKHK